MRMRDLERRAAIVNVAIFRRRFGRAIRIQYALNGDWERAPMFTARDSLPSDGEMHRYLESSPDWACEVFFADAGYGETFFGLRLCDGAIEDKLKVVKSLHAALKDAATLERTLALLNRDTGAILLEGDCDFVEFGVCNLWKSAGSIRVWERCGSVPVNLAEFLEANAPQYLRPQSNPLIGEFAIETPLLHWIGVPISNPVESGHALDLRRAAELLLVASRPDRAIPRFGERTPPVWPTVRPAGPRRLLPASPDTTEIPAAAPQPASLARPGRTRSDSSCTPPRFPRAGTSARHRKR